jgi:hypothetical protein
MNVKVRIDLHRPCCPISSVHMRPRKFSGTRIQLSRHTFRTFEILASNRGTKTRPQRISSLNYIVLISPLEQWHDWPKRLLNNDPRVFRWIVNDSRRDEIAIPRLCSLTCQCSLLPAFPNLIVHILHLVKSTHISVSQPTQHSQDSLRLILHRPHDNAFLRALPRLDIRLRILHHAITKRLINSLMHINPLRQHAYLARVQKTHHRDARRTRLYVNILTYNRRIIATQLERALLQRLRARRSD